MKVISNTIFIITITLCSIGVFAQSGENVNAASKLMLSDRNLTIGGYGQIDYNQPMGNNTISNGKLDVHRMVLLFGYRFNDKLNFITEIEIEHVKEVYVEQAFLNYSFNTYLNLRGGLMLVPMGIINEYHEPTTFNGVERPLIDYYIAPTTWREIGIGATGTVPELSLKYQAYIMNGFASYSDGSKLSGKYGMRKGRQKGAESFIRTPAFAGRLDYFGIRGLNLGFSLYSGKTQSSLYKNIDKSDAPAISEADSSVVNMTMFGLDAKYQISGIQLRAQGYYSTLSNTMEYNYFTATDNVVNDLGNSMYGYYLEVGYNVFHELIKVKSELIVFARFSEFDTQHSVMVGSEKNPDFHKQAITYGLGWKPISSVAIKADIQMIRPESSNSWSNTFNAGIGVWF